MHNKPRHLQELFVIFSSFAMALSVLLFLTCVASGMSSSTPHHLTHFTPALYKDAHCDPTETPPCATNSTIFCLVDKDYPSYQIKAAINADYFFDKKYSDIPHQSADDLIDMITKEQEEAFDYSFYTGATTGPSPLDITHWSGPEGYICPSSVEYAMPKRAKNVQGHWRVIVNDLHYYTQTVRVESCLFPESTCRAMPPCFNSHCTQKYMYHRLLSFDSCDPYKGLFIDIYRLPSACSCHIDRNYLLANDQ